MRKAEFYVPAEVIEEFSDEMIDRDLKGTITGTSTENDIIIEVDYGKNETKAVDELESVLDNLCESIEEEEEEEEEEDER